MTDPDGAQRAREWLERQLADLGQLRNATRRDQNFKTVFQVAMKELSIAGVR